MKIYIDSREPKSFIDKLRTYFPVEEIEMGNLPYGDVIIGELAIERKTLRDFLSSITSGRIWEQLKGLREFKFAILVLHGGLYEALISHKNPLQLFNSYLSTLATIALRFRIPIVYLRNEEEVLKFILSCYRIMTKEEKGERPLPVRKTCSIPEVQENIIACFPRIGLKKARKILREGKTVLNVFNSLNSLTSISEKDKRIIEEIITKEYKEEE